MPTERKTSKGLFGEENCERPACDTIKQSLPGSLDELKKIAAKQDGRKKVQCPPKSADLGRSSWKLLHTMAAWYPDAPSQEQKTKITNFFTALSEFYPCPWCAQDFREEMSKMPPATESREDLCLWLCNQHNKVNKKLGKPVFPCTMENLDERWRKSSNSKCN